MITINKGPETKNNIQKERMSCAENLKRPKNKTFLHFNNLSTKMLMKMNNKSSILPKYAPFKENNHNKDSKEKLKIKLDLLDPSIYKLIQKKKNIFSKEINKKNFYFNRKFMTKSLSKNKRRISTDKKEKNQSFRQVRQNNSIKQLDDSNRFLKNQIKEILCKKEIQKNEKEMLCKKLLFEKKLDLMIRTKQKTKNQKQRKVFKSYIDMVNQNLFKQKVKKDSLIKSLDKRNKNVSFYQPGNSKVKSKHVNKCFFIIIP